MNRKNEDAYYEHLSVRLGSRSTADLVRAANERPPRVSVRANLSRTSVERFRAWANDQSLALSPIPWAAEGFFAAPGEAAGGLGRTVEHHQGLFYLQEAASMLPVQVLDHVTGGAFESVIDLCAAPGSKTTQLAARMGPRGVIVANEPSASRLKTLAFNLTRAGVGSAVLLSDDGQKIGGFANEAFDAVLLDAPCSGEGNARSDPRPLADWRPGTALRMAKTQVELLLAAAELVKPGGCIVYSTCTLAREEDEDVIAAFLGASGDAFEICPLGGAFPGAEAALTPEGHLLLLPHLFDTEGFFVACVRKRRSLGRNVAAPFLANVRRPQALECGFASEVVAAAATYGIRLAETELFSRGEDVYWIRAAAGRFALDRPTNRPGTPIAVRGRRGIEFSHEFAMVFGAEATARTAEIDRADAARFFSGLEIRTSLQGVPEGEVLLRHGGSPLGFLLWRAGRKKTLLPDGWIRPLKG